MGLVEVVLGGAILLFLVPQVPKEFCRGWKAKIFRTLVLLHQWFDTSTQFFKSLDDDDTKSTLSQLRQLGPRVRPLHLNEARLSRCLQLQVRMQNKPSDISQTSPFLILLLLQRGATFGRFWGSRLGEASIHTICVANPAVRLGYFGEFMENCAGQPVNTLCCRSVS